MKLLQFIGVANVAFIIFNGSYEFSSEYFSNTTMISTLLILVILSFVKDIFDFIGYKIVYKPLERLFRFITILITGVLSSFVILIPKLIFMESHQLDSMHVKFTARIVRIWNKEELSAHLSNLVDNRGVSHIISDIDREQLIETSNSMGGLKDAFNSLVNERLASLIPKTVESESIVVSVAKESSWISENTLLIVAGTVVVIAAAAGIGYLIYKSYSSAGVKIDDTASTGFLNQTEDPQVDIFDGNFITDESSSGSDSGVTKSTFDVNDKGLHGEIEGVATDLVNTELELNGRIDLLSEEIGNLERGLSASIAELDKKVKAGGDSFGVLESHLLVEAEKLAEKVERLSKQFVNLEGYVIGTDVSLRNLIEKKIGQVGKLSGADNPLRAEFLEFRGTALGRIANLRAAVKKLTDTPNLAEGHEALRESIEENSKIISNLTQNNSLIDAKITEMSKTIATTTAPGEEDAKTIKEMFAEVINTQKTSTANFKRLSTTTDKRFEVMEATQLEEAKSFTEFTESLVDTAFKELKEQILSTEELVAVRALISNETIRDMLKAEEVKKLIGSIKGEKG